MDNKLKLITVKERKIKFLKLTDLLLRIVLTLIGTISLVGVLMFLNSMLGIGYFSCLVITLIVPPIYSFVVNTSLIRFDNKISNMELEVERMIDECNKEDDKLEDDVIIKDIEIRFDGLSNERKMELLMYIKDKLRFDLSSQHLSKVVNQDSLSLMDLYIIKDNNDVCDNTVLDKEDNEIYTKSKKKRDL